MEVPSRSVMRERESVILSKVKPVLTSELRTLEAAESLRRVTAQVGEKVRPVTGVSLGVVGQAQGDRNVGVLSLTRHLHRTGE